MTGLISVPCFNEGIFWIKTIENDEKINDQTQVALVCKNIQLGINNIVLKIKEDIAGVTNTAEVTKIVTENSTTQYLNFGNPNDVSNVAEYTFQFNATKNCFLRPDQTEFVRTSTQYKFAGVGFRG